MVEVSQSLNTNLLSEEKSSPKLTTNRPTDEQMAALRRSAASKRSLMKMRASRGSNRNRQSPSSPNCPSKSPNSPNSSAEDDPKRSRGEEGCPSSPAGGRPKPLFQRRTRNHSAPLFLEPIDNDSSAKASSAFPEIFCQVSRVPKHRLQFLLKSEPEYHPNNAFLYYVDPVAEDKVDATLRNEAVHNLRFMHNAFFTLTAEAFCKAVNLIDRFIVKVKVKPKYMSCVAAASYYAAAKLVESAPDLGVPSPDALVQISHCGGNSADLLRMEDILKSKLGGDLDGVNAFDFLRLFASTAMVLPESAGSSTTTTPTFDFPGGEEEEFDVKEGQLLLAPHSLPEQTSEGEGKLVPQSRRMYDLWSAMTSRLVVALCSLEIYRFRPAAVALAVLYQFRVAGVAALARLCEVQLSDIHQCAALIEELYDVYYRDSCPTSRKALVWTLSKRTLFRIGCSSPTPLDTISEDCENDKEDNLQFLFEP